ncbi:50S ribosomal protein L25 [Nocardioides jiangxiensis]|uniref:50S ribosomal protein L25 n=1 Tax=Nocardioides jiangxiensis TaxID=3064524 RepID=A0ABT9B1R4_9ACTN|nr:50S ribosomal protein L25 [Nocardioides sp. WY-20]MDO7868791.1 50S ribosomal protein L25 [Nocardioides sp. WY-20]
MAVEVSINITAEVRTEFGKGAARRARRAGQIPAVVYGQGEPVHINLPGHLTTMALRKNGTQAVLILDIAGQETYAQTKAIQVDPLKRVIEHIDFIVVDAAAGKEAIAAAEAAVAAAEEEAVAEAAAEVVAEAEAVVEDAEAEGIEA